MDAKVVIGLWLVWLMLCAEAAVDAVDRNWVGFACHMCAAGIVWVAIALINGWV
jgi:hypothetical protein